MAAQAPFGERAVTVVVPTLNRPGPARAAIQSVLDQDGVRAELLVSENGSDRSFEAAYTELFAWLPARARLVRQAHRIPVEEHFPRLLELVDTPYVVFLADDDLLTPTFLQRALGTVATTGAGCVFGPYLTKRARTGKSRVESYDFTQRSTWLRAARFLCRRDDAFIYGLFRTEILRVGMREFRPLPVLGRRTLIRIAYAPLFSCLLSAPYAHLRGEPVWINAADSVKSETYLGKNKVMKVVELLLGEWVLAARFLRLAYVRQGSRFAATLAPLIAAMALCHCIGFTLMAAGRFGAELHGRLRRA